ncbi:unnamed protein product [Bursaphelenchus xylophilus]|uniref:(pine wood nematode) hypothetical protein n=1 Tax=Bursaphelenchus xylophilus TaxID=6326 RepID=A0A811JYQ8_BURXY|nr:unnamed protein product [Bursaphelenchus xylophilus]CAG9080350.1 unnamed protein product [Bursaphelenchus xylophilus]
MGVVELNGTEPFVVVGTGPKDDDKVGRGPKELVDTGIGPIELLEIDVEEIGARLVDEKTGVEGLLDPLRLCRPCRVFLRPKSGRR